MIDGQKRSFMQFQDVRAFLDSVLDEDIHTKRVDSLANATLGVMTGASLGVAIIGKSLAQARGLLPKHAIKQVDRLLSNRKLEAWDLFATWVPELIGSRTDLIVAMDWTDFVPFPLGFQICLYDFTDPVQASRFLGIHTSSTALTRRAPSVGSHSPGQRE